MSRKIGYEAHLEIRNVIYRTLKSISYMLSLNVIEVLHDQLCYPFIYFLKF